jgi:hypothetical protein
VGKPFKGKIELDIRDFVADREAFLPEKARENAPAFLQPPRGSAGVELVFDVAVEKHFAAAMARD